MKFKRHVGFRELPVVQRQIVKWRELSIDTGIGQDSLESVSVPEKGGGLAFACPWHHRFIYWRTQQSTIELIEESLSARLQGNRLRIKLVNTSILPDSVLLLESSDRYVVLLICSPGSLHRVAFPHPSQLPDSNRSIFADATPNVLQDYHRPTTLPGQIALCANFLTASNDAMFVLGTQNSLHLLTFYASGEVTSQELQRKATIKRRLTNMLSNSIRLKSNTEEAPAALACLEHQGDFLIFALCYDRRLCVWSFNQGEIVANESIIDILNAFNTVCTPDDPAVSRTTFGIKPVFDRNSLIVSAFDTFAILQPVVHSNHCIALTTLACIPFPGMNLVDFNADSSRLWVLFLGAHGEPFMASIDYTKDCEYNAGVLQSKDWLSVHWADPINLERRTHVGDVPRGVQYLDKIFRQDCFGALALAKAASIFSRTEFADYPPPPGIGTLHDSILDMLQLAVERRVQLLSDCSNENEESVTADVYKRFMSFVIQYQNDALKPLGILLGEHFTGVVRADQLGILQECDDVERVLLSNRLSEDQHLHSRGVMQFVECLSLVSRALDTKSLNMFSKLILTNGSVEEEIVQVATRTNLDRDFNSQFIKAAKDVGRSWSDVLSRLLVLIDSEVTDPPEPASSKGSGELGDSEGHSSSAQMSWKTVLSGSLGTTLLWQNTYQRAMLMYDLCQRLVVFEVLLAQNHSSVGISSSKAHSIRFELLPSTVDTMRSYFMVLWACETYADDLHGSPCSAGTTSLLPKSVLGSNRRGVTSALKAANNLTSVQLTQTAQPASSIYSNFSMKDVDFHSQLGYQQETLFPHPTGLREASFITVMELFLDNDNTAVQLALRKQHSAQISTSTSMRSRGLSNLILDVTKYNCCLLSPSQESSYQLLQVLMEKEQYAQLEECTRLLQWDPFRLGLKSFLLAHALLKRGEVERACDMFIASHDEAISDVFVLDQIAMTSSYFQLNVTDAENEVGAAMNAHTKIASPKMASVAYFARIIALLESFGCSGEQYVVRIARASLERDPPADHVARLQSIIFRYELRDERVERACDALAGVPNREMQLACLRELIGVAIENRRVDWLVDFGNSDRRRHLSDLRDELLHMMAQRARCSDLPSSSPAVLAQQDIEKISSLHALPDISLYDVLYACYISDCDYRSAAWFMFEQGVRYSRECSPTAENLSKRELCYLSAITCMMLLKDRYIVRPKILKDPSVIRSASPIAIDIEADSKAGPTIMMPGSSARSVVSDDDLRETMDILTLEDMEKELCLVQSWLRLLPLESAVPGGPLNPSETITLLVRHSMYDSVTRLCDLFNLDRSVLFESVAKACCKATPEREDATVVGPRNPAWILENTEFVNFVPKAAWFYLRHLLLKTKGTRYFRICAQTFFSFGCSPQAWFVQEYQKRNPADLLAVYIAYERLMEATQLACSMVKAALGSNPDGLFCQDTVSGSCAVWVPLHLMDLLQWKLSEINGEHAGQLRDQLLSSLKNLFNKVKQVALLR